MALLYLEDFVSAIEQLPQDIKHSFSTMRTLDLRLQNTMDTTERKRRSLFERAASMRPADRAAEFEGIQQGQRKAKEYAEEKLQIATQTSDLIGRLMRHLDTELKKFGGELESGNKGITKTLEERSLALDEKEESIPSFDDSFRKPRFHPSNGAGAAVFGGADASEASDVAAAAPRRIQKASARKQRASGAGTGYMPAARLASPALTGGAFGGGRGSSMLVDLDPYVLPTPPPIALQQPATASPEEARYCTCRQVSYGEMVGCDNDSCPIEWFHYACVGITEPPKGKWYCPLCRVTMKRR